jgi:TPR repeat protein
MDVEINKKNYNINKNEFNIVIHNEYNNLIIRENLGKYERIVSLLKELSQLVRQCLFFSQSHGGFIPVNVACCYDNICLLKTSVKHYNNIKENLLNHGVHNVSWDFDNAFSNETFVVFSENYENIDEEIIQRFKPIVLTNLNQKLLNSGIYTNIYELTNSNLALFIPSNINNSFLKVFGYYVDGNALFYDNLIHLCIMVKNGGKQFENMLNENMHLIDRWTILDTGSTDDTVETVERVLVGKKKGELFQEPFINFRDSRNRLLDLAGDSYKFTLMLDDTYIVKGNLRNFLNEIRGDQYSDSFSLYVQSDDVEYISNRILKTDRKLKYVFKIHEIIQEAGNKNVVIPQDRSLIFDGKFDYMEERTMARKKLDIQLLNEEVEDDPNNPRSYYYLGQTYYLLKDYEKAYHYFLARVNHEVDGYLQEKMDAAFEAARVANFKLNKPWKECEELYLKAYELDNERPDALYFIGIHYFLNGERKTAFNYFKKAFEIGYPIHRQYSLKPTLSFHFLPKFLAQLAYEYQDYQIGEKCCILFLEKNKPDADMYNVILSWHNIFIKLNMMNALSDEDFSRFSSEKLFCFVADGGFEPWTGSDILTKGVGGSETYIIEMARYIQKSGKFKVVVFCNCLEKSLFENVEYIPISLYSPFVNEVDIHTCVVSRFSEYIPVSIHGKVQNLYLVLHDLGPSGLVIPIHEKLKKIFCLSEWHVEHFLTIFPQFKDITVPFYYGIDVNKFDNEQVIPLNVTPSSNITIKIVESDIKVKNKFIYSSFPNRGLLQLLEMWPKIYEKYPNASLHIYSDINGKWVNNVSGEIVKKIRKLLFSVNDCNINYYGWVNKSELAEAWRTSEYWFYPCTFMETFCLTALEAALSKTLAITNGLAALQNTVGDRGICIHGDAKMSEWQDIALKELFSIMSDDSKEKRRALINVNYTWASKLSWKNQANKLLEIISK